MQAHASNHLLITFQPSSDAVPMIQWPSFSTPSNARPHLQADAFKRLRLPIQLA
jgi:hypothetical protein